MTDLVCCPVPGCDHAIPKENEVCVECYFSLPPHEARLLVRTRIVRDRAESEEARARLTETLERYLEVAISHVPSRPASAPSQATESAPVSSAWSEIGYRRARP